MNEEHTPENPEGKIKNSSNSLNTVTPLSKYLAMALFVAMPFIGGWVGYSLAPVEIVEVEKVLVREQPVAKTAEIPLQENITQCDGGVCDITELGFRFALTGTGTTLYVPNKPSTDGTIVILLSNSVLADYDSWCAPRHSPLGRIVRVKKTTIENEYRAIIGSGHAPQWISDPNFLAQASESPVESMVFDMQDSYIIYIGPQAACSDNGRINTLQSELVQQLKKAIAESLLKSL